MRIVLTPSDLAFLERWPETLLMTIEPVADCDGAVCHAPAASKRFGGAHLHLTLTTPEHELVYVQFIEIEG